MFRDYREGLVYTDEEEQVPVFMKLLPEGVTAAAGGIFFIVRKRMTDPGST